MSKNEYRNQLKRIFTGYRRFTPQIQHELLELGICTGRKKNHVVLFVYSHGFRRTVTISTTASDNRVGLNIVSKIMGYM